LSPGRFYNDDYRDTLSELVAVLLAAEGPIRDEVLAQHVARTHGVQRTGRRIQDAVSAALPHGVETTIEDGIFFLWPPGVMPDAWANFRAPPAGRYRDPLEIPMQGLRVLAANMLYHGSLDKEVLVLMRNALGIPADA